MRLPKKEWVLVALCIEERQKTDNDADDEDRKWLKKEGKEWTERNIINGTWCTRNNKRTENTFQTPSFSSIPLWFHIHTHNIFMLVYYYFDSALILFESRFCVYHHRKCYEIHNHNNEGMDDFLLFHKIKQFACLFLYLGIEIEIEIKLTEILGGCSCNIGPTK